MLDMTEHFGVTGCQPKIRYPGKCNLKVYSIYSVLLHYKKLLRTQYCQFKKLILILFYFSYIHGLLICYWQFCPKVPQETTQKQ